jgi:nicotinamidase-related amidase
LQSYCLKYTRRLEAGGKFKLTIWPDHCLIGSDGHAIEQHIQEAVREWDIHHYTKTVKHIHKVRRLVSCSSSVPWDGLY